MENSFSPKYTTTVLANGSTRFDFKVISSTWNAFTNGMITFFLSMFVATLALAVFSFALRVEMEKMGWAGWAFPVTWVASAYYIFRSMQENLGRPRRHITVVPGQGIILMNGKTLPFADIFEFGAESNNFGYGNVIATSGGHGICVAGPFEGAVAHALGNDIKRLMTV